MSKANGDVFSEKKLELLEQILKKKGISTLKSNSIPKRADNDECRLSFAQQRLWFLDQMEEGGSAYNIPAAIRIKGMLDIGILKKCFNEVIGRHEALRTRFESNNGKPLQKIEQLLEIEIPLVDLSALKESLIEDEVKRLAKEDGQKSFQLSKGPLIRVTLLKVSPEEYVLLLSMHHIISDGWSMGLLVKEISEYYEAYLKGSRASIPELRIQYGDYSEWQRNWLQGTVLESEMGFWRNLLKGAPTIINLPTDRTRPSVQSSNGAIKFFSLPKELSRSVKQLSQKENATTFMTLLAAYGLLLYKYTGQEDILIGTPVAGRERLETESLIGFFVNTLVLRTDLSGDPTFTELLARMREMALGVYSHQNIPFEKLVEEFQDYRDMSRSPLFQVMFMMQNTAMPPLKISGLELSFLELDSRSSQFDLSLSLKEDEGGLKGTFEYNTDLLDESTIDRMVGHYENLLGAIAGNPNEKISLISILSKEEEKRITEEWNNTFKEYPGDKCIYELFEEQAMRTPEETAVISETAGLTYKELKLRAEKVAGYLQKKGLKVGSYVGIYMDSCLEMIIGILGVLKTGAAYIPLDPDYPKDRTGFMIDDSGVSFILTCDSLKKDITAQCQKVICLDGEWDQIEKDGHFEEALDKSPDNLACVIYTSGSSGQPKGVLLQNRGIVNLITSFILSYNAGKYDRVLPLTSIASASFVGEILPVLCAGGALVLMNKAKLLDMDKLISAISSYGISIISTVPSIMARLNSNVEKLPKLRIILSGGEALTAGEIENLLEKTTVVNGYGLTETTICSTYYILDKSEMNSSKLVPIGKPIMNHSVYILDKNRMPVPVGCSGEIYIGGVGVAKGYLNNVELTNERFLDNPFKPGEKVYKTGDVGKWLPNGSLLYIGRYDQQIKIRGFRIELGEIESRINEYHGVQDCAVIVREELPGVKELTAYLVDAGEKDFSLLKLREWLKEKLPGYMIPVDFVVMDKLPLTPNGKVDLKALPAPSKENRETGSIYEAPQDDMERIITEVWQEYLNLNNVGINDNFFDIGGHSLLLAQVHSSLKEKLGKNLTIIDLFKYPTVKSLAKYLSRQENKNNSSNQVKERAEKQREAFNRQRQQRQYYKVGEKND